MSIVIFSMGMGANIVKYCCLDCEDTIIYFSNHKCCSIHHQKEMKNTDPDCSSATFGNLIDNMNECAHSINSTKQTTTYIKKSSSNCSISRVSMVLNMPLDRLIIATPIVWLSDLSLILFNVNFMNTASVTEGCETFDDPPNILPRAYLAIIRILII